MLKATHAVRGQSVFDEARKWQGQILADSGLLLRQYLGDSDRSAVFLTDLDGDQAPPAVIKLIAADSASADFQLAGWKKAAQLSHPNLARIFDAGRCRLDDEELLFVVTEQADETLSQILLQRALTPEEVKDMLTPALDALAYVHANGYAHGRVKPSNIMAVKEQLKLSSDSLGHIGTPTIFPAGIYGAPEASVEGLTPAGDVWSLGITLVEALTQRVPIWSDKLQGEPLAPSALPEPFAEIVKRCLVPDPGSRSTLPEISAHLKPPAVVPVPEQTRNIDSAAVATGARKLGNNWLYAVPILAIVAVALLLTSLLRLRPAPPSSNSSTSQASAAATATAKQPFTRPKPNPSARKEPRGPASALQSGSTPTPVAPAGDRILRQVLPNVPEKALSTIQGRVRVQVKVMVDAAGNVTQVDLASAGPSRYFASLATQAARDWKFSEGQPQRMWLLQFVFANTGATVHPHRQPHRG